MARPSRSRRAPRPPPASEARAPMKNISAWAIRHPVSPVVLFVVLLFLGTVAFNRLPRHPEPRRDASRWCWCRCCSRVPRRRRSRRRSCRRSRRRWPASATSTTSPRSRSRVSRASSCSSTSARRSIARWPTCATRSPRCASICRRASRSRPSPASTSTATRSSPTR